jgi:CubicO group peptidase (beta-lactamase class C family)
LFLFYKGLKNNSIISKESRNEMFKTRWPNARRGTAYALGWRKRKFEDETWMFHSGWWHGFRTNFYFNIDRDECAVILSNRLSGGFIPGNLIVAIFHPDIRNKWLGIKDPGASNHEGEDD